jgi:DNA-binding MarR family transcriptional regulator
MTIPKPRSAVAALEEFSLVGVRSHSAENRLFQVPGSVENVYMTRVNVPRKTDPLTDEVFASIHTIMHLFRAEQYRVLREGRYDLTHMEGKILGFFIRHPGATLRDLVAHMKQDKGQLARLIRSLKDHGLLEAQAGARDRRSVPLRATREGRRIHQALQRQVRKLSELAVKGLDPDERHQLVTLLDKVQSNLEDVRDAASFARR